MKVEISIINVQSLILFHDIFFMWENVVISSMPIHCYILSPVQSIDGEMVVTIVFNFKFRTTVVGKA